MAMLSVAGNLCSSFGGVRQIRRLDCVAKVAGRPWAALGRADEVIEQHRRDAISRRIAWLLQADTWAGSLLILRFN
jgi:hypothetical protein